MKIPTDKTFERLRRILDNPDLGGEDWDLTFADPDRLAEFCDLYEHSPLNANEKAALMQLIVASYDRYLDKAPYPDEFEARISKWLKQEFDLHKDTIIYWSGVESHSSEIVWPVSPLIRNILLKYNGEA